MTIENKMIIGYQWGETFQFIGEYQFPNNLDKEEIHVGPRTTLIQPPAETKDEYARWDVDQGNWVLTERPFDENAAKIAALDQQLKDVEAKIKADQEASAE